LFPCLRCIFLRFSQKRKCRVNFGHCLLKLPLFSSLVSAIIVITLGH
jgi:hypothetical protein